MDDDKSREGTGEFGMGEGAVSADVSVAVAECVDSLPASDAEGEGEGQGQGSGLTEEATEENAEEAYLRGRNDAIREIMNRPGLYESPVEHSTGSKNEGDSLTAGFLTRIRPSAWD